MSGDLKAIGAAVRAARRRLGLHRIELAEVTGFTRSSIANIEAGRQDMPITKVAAIAEALHTTVATLLGEHQPVELPEVLIVPGHRVHCVRCGLVGFAVDHAEAREIRTNHLRRDHLEG